MSDTREQYEFIANYDFVEAAATIKLTDQQITDLQDVFYCAGYDMENARVILGSFCHIPGSRDGVSEEIDIRHVVFRVFDREASLALKEVADRLKEER